MTRRDFELIANLVRSYPLRRDSDRVRLARHLASGLASTNPQFDRERFVRACTQPDADAPPSAPRAVYLA